MMKQKSKIKFLILFIFALGISCNNSIKTVKTKSTNKDVENLQTIIDSIYKSNPESVGLMVHIESPKNGISWSGGSGYSEKEKKTKLLSNQPVLIASSIKTYISATILRLQEQDKLNIENSIEEYLTPKTATLLHNDGYELDQIKIKHLLSHTSGIADYVNDDYIDFIDKNQTYRWTRDEQIQLATKVGNPLKKPQTSFKYADVNYLLATEIIEQITHKPFYTSIRELLKYEELGLNHTWFPTLEDSPPNTPKLAHQYWNEKQWGSKKLDIAWDSYKHDISWDLYGGGGIATTMKELAQFSYNLFNGNIIKNKNVLNLITTDVQTSDEIPKTYRLGVADTRIKGLQSYGHGGFWGTIVFYIPKLDASIAVCVLERNGKMKAIKSTLNTLVTELTKKIHPTENVISKNYELYKAKDAKATLVLFPGGADSAKETKVNFEIITAAAANQVSVLLMNFNRHLWIDEPTTQQLSTELESIFSVNNLNSKNVFIGGMSIGGNVTLTLSDYLVKNKSNITPKGVFIVDSPIDLYALYKSSKKDITNPDFNEDRLAEPKWIINSFEEEFSKDSLLTNIQKVAPFTQKSNYTSVPRLKNCKLRFYTEPDSLWWKENRQTDFENTNAYSIQQIAKNLNSEHWDKFELIETENKGFRTNGERHPHSWTIVDVLELIKWIKE